MRHVVPEPVLRKLGATGFSEPASGLLTAGQHSKRLLLLRAMLDLAGTDPRVEEDWSLLEAAERKDPHAVRQVLLYPTVGAWAEQSIRRLRGSRRGRLRVSCFGHLGAVAAAAAVRAGLPFRSELRLRGPGLTLPTLGAVHADGGTVVVTGGPQGARLRLPGRARAVEVRPYGADWLQLDALRPRLVSRAPVLLDDVDPFRGPEGGVGQHALPPASRLTEAERLRWQTVWRAGTALLDRVAPDRCAEVSALLRCVVPLDGHTRETERVSATSREAFGAVLATCPGTPADLAATLVHEIQHAKLGALMDLVLLHTAGSAPRHWAPWRPDPRPLDGLLQGVYAHLALADWWQRAALAATRPRHRHTAWTEHARCREQVAAVLETLPQCGELTPQGRLFVEEMAAKHAALQAHPPPGAHLARAAAQVRAARRAWIARHAHDKPG